MGRTRRDFLENIFACAGVAWGLHTVFSTAVDKIRYLEYSQFGRYRGRFAAKPIMPYIIDIANKIENHARANSNTGTLFVPFGETHETPSHVLTLPGVLEVLKQRGFRIACGMELPYDRTAWAFLGQVLSRDHYNRLSEDGSLDKLIQELNCDAHGKKTIINAKNRIKDFQARRAREILNDYHVTSDISLSNNDVAKTRGKINYGDMLTRWVLDKLYDEEEQSHGVESTGGMRARNAFMAQMARSHAVFTEADIYIQHCGSAHVLGGEDHAYQDSLTVCIEELGAKSFPVILDSGDHVKSFLSATAVKRIEDGFGILKGDLPDDGFYYGGLDEAAAKLLAEHEDDYISSLIDGDYRNVVLRNSVAFEPQAKAEACGNSFHWKEELHAAAAARKIAHPSRRFLP